MTDQQTPARTNNPAAEKWAPWWLYLIVLLGANYLRSYLLPGGALPLILAIAIGQAALLFGVITVIWRATRRSDS